MLRYLRTILLDSNVPIRYTRFYQLRFYHTFLLIRLIILPGYINNCITAYFQIWMYKVNIPIVDSSASMNRVKHYMVVMFNGIWYSHRKHPIIKCTPLTITSLAYTRFYKSRFPHTAKVSFYKKWDKYLTNSSNNKS